MARELPGMALATIYTREDTVSFVYLPRDFLRQGLRCYLALNYPTWRKCIMDGSRVYQFSETSENCPALGKGHLGLPECRDCPYWNPS